MKEQQAVLDFDSRQLRFRRGRKHLVWRCHERDDDCSDSSMFLNAVQLQRALDDGYDAFYVNVTTVREHDTSHAPHIDQLETELKQLLTEYSDRFPEDITDLPPEREVDHVIPLLDPAATPPFRALYRLSPAEHAEVQKQVTDLLAKGYIEPSSSPYGAPILFVRKKDGTLRMVIDYRALNRLIVKNRYPLPRIDDLLDAAQGAQYFSSLDLMSGYHQIRIRPEYEPKTAFRTPMGLYQWRVLSFGLTNAPATFQAVMNRIFRPYLGKFVLVYLDDILVISKAAAEHIEHLRIVLQLLRDHLLFAKMAKCAFGRTEVEFQGHILGQDGLRVDPKKTAVVRDWQTPRSVADVRSFLGLANCFRKFVRAYSTMVAPLTNLTRKDVPFEWSPACQTAFDQVKAALTSSPVLSLPDPDKPFDVVWETCGVGIGAVLMQDGHPNAFGS